VIEHEQDGEKVKCVCICTAMEELASFRDNDLHPRIGTSFQGFFYFLVESDSSVTSI